MAKSNAGRPTVMTESVVRKLEEGFLLSFSDSEACLFAGISTTSLYKYCVENPEFAERKELLKKKTGMKAKKNISEAINDGDEDLSRWWLERKCKDEFSTKQDVDVTTKGESINAPPSEERLKAARDKIMSDIKNNG